jgi:hypothetical protein
MAAAHQFSAVIDWGRPQPVGWREPRERLVALVPAEVAGALRQRARDEGLALSVLVGRLLAGALDMTFDDRVGSREPWPAGVEALIG